MIFIVNNIPIISLNVFKDGFDNLENLAEKINEKATNQYSLPGPSRKATTYHLITTGDKS